MKFCDMTYADGVPVVEHPDHFVYSVTPGGEVCTHNAPLSIGFATARDHKGQPRVLVDSSWTDPAVLYANEANAIRKAIEVTQAKASAQVVTLADRLSKIGGVA